MIVPAGVTPTNKCSLGRDSLARYYSSPIVKQVSGSWVELAHYWIIIALVYYIYASVSRYLMSVLIAILRFPSTDNFSTYNKLSGWKNKREKSVARNVTEMPRVRLSVLGSTIPNFIQLFSIPETSTSEGKKQQKRVSAYPRSPTCY